MFAQLLLVLAIVAVGALAVVNRVRVFSIRRGLRVPFTAAPSEQLRIWANSRIWSFARDHGTATAAATLTTGEAIYHFSEIDSSVLDAVDRIYEPFEANSFSELLSHFEKLTAAGPESWQGAVNAYKGAFGETILAEHLRAQGHVVELATNTSEPGWDALIDGERVQMKAGVDPDQITTHLERYPDIPVITVSEHLATFDGDARVECLPDISGVDIDTITKSTMDHAVGIVDFDIQVPVLTAIFACARNFSPIFKGTSNDLVTAAKYTAIDTAGIGVGAAAGAKAGALFGAVGGPIGALIGGVAGGLIGAFGGRLVANLTKEAALRRATVALDSAFSEYAYVYCNAIGTKADALQLKSCELAPKVGLWRRIRPSVGDVVRSDTRKALQRWVRYCRKSQVELRSALQHCEKGDANAGSSSDIGQRLLTVGGAPEPVFSPALTERRRVIPAAAAQVIDELGKLGRRPSPA